MNLLRSFCIVDAIQAALVAVLVWPVAAFITADAREVWLITPHSAESVEMNRAMWEMDHPDATVSAGSEEDRDTVIRLYGNPTGETIRVLGVSESQLIHPEEMPSLALLPQDKTKGDNVLQEQTVWFFTRWTSFVAGIVAVVLFALWALLSWRRRKQQAAAGRAADSSSASSSAA